MEGLFCSGIPPERTAKNVLPHWCEHNQGSSDMHPELELNTGEEQRTTFGPWLSAGSILTALVTSVCCIGPLLFTALGLSSFASLWILRHLVPYRRLFLILTLVCLGLGFYATYRKGTHVRLFDQSILWASTLLVLAVLGYSLYVEGLVLF